MKMKFRSITFLLPTLLVVSTSTWADQKDDPQGHAFFEKNIRPVLTEHCYKCHSSKSRKVRGKLLLDSQAGWAKGGESGPAIVPGKPEKSPLISALRYEDFEMPPKSKLPQEVIDNFVKWVEMGAPDPRKESKKPNLVEEEFDLDKRKTWWSLQPLKDLTPPKVKNKDWAKTSYDQFILQKLEEKNWQPAPAASRESWLRRVTYDLTGLPPSPNDLHNFLNDLSDQAFEKVVDRLLKSPHFGERWARHWMDLVRYADSKSFEADYLMANTYQYRDYLIRAFNQDVSFKQFFKEALAGDLLKEPRLDPETGRNESVMGPGFIYLTDGQHGPPDIHADEARIFEGMIDVIGKAFLGYTVACTRCHDHKFDAITTKDYYSLYGIIASSRLNYADVNPPKKQVEYRKELIELKAPVQKALAHLLTSDFKEIKNDLKAALENKPETDHQKRWAEALKKKPNTELRSLAQILQAKDEVSLKRVIEEIKKRELPSKVQLIGNPKKERQSFANWIPTGVDFEDAPRPNGDFVITPNGDKAIASIVGGYPASGHLASRFGGSYRSPTFTLSDRVSIRVKGKNVRVSLIIRHYELVGRGPTTGGTTKVINSDTWQTVNFNTYLWEGEKAFIEILQNGGEFRFAADTGGHVDGAYAQVGTAINAHGAPPEFPGGKVWSNTKIDTAKIKTGLDLASVVLSSLPAKWLQGKLSLAENDLLAGLVEAGAIDLNIQRSGELKKSIEAYRKYQHSLPRPTYVRSLTDGNGEDEHVYIRGSHKNISKVPNPRRFLEAIDDRTFKGRGSGRLEWAEALVSDSNPLAPRVFVNRIWHHLFGQGIVNSVDDFGYMGSQPSHPELLDHLAKSFITKGGSTKGLIKELVLSNTYRMSSRASQASLDQDPNNHLLQHMPVKRLQAEAIRDTLVSLSGNLRPQLFGRSVNANDMGRRSIYVQLRRKGMPHFLMLFDMPDGTEPFGRRNVTQSPSQALEFMNGEFSWRVADSWAKRLLKVSKDKSFNEAVDLLHQQAFGRRANEKEAAWAKTVLSDSGIKEKEALKNFNFWKSFCHTMLNRKELLYVY